MSAGRHVNTLSQEWCTPAKYVNAVTRFYDGEIELDPCSNTHSIVHAKVEFMLPETDGLKQEWNYSKIYVNPPYGSDKERGTTIKNWLAKCCLANETYNAQVVALVPVATNTSHWKQCVFGKASAICFLYDTRLRFLINGSEEHKGAPMACCMIYWGDNIDKFTDVFAQYGAVIDISKLQRQKFGVETLFVAQLFEDQPAYATG